MIEPCKVRPGSTIRIPFGSYAASTGASSATTNYAAADVLIYKNGSTTQRSSSNGITATTDFDALTGINVVTIDLSDNTVAAFYAAGSEYIVVIADVTIDGQTVRFPIGRFVIGVDGAQVETTINTLASQTSFTLLTGPAEDNALVGCTMYIHDVSSAVQCAYGYITAYTGASKTVTLAAAPTYTIAADDNVSIFPPVGIHNFGGTAVTARDIGASVLLSSGTGAGQLDFTSGVVKGNVTQWNGTTVSSPATAGIPDINVKNINNVAAATPGASGGILISGSNSGTTTLAALTVTGTTTMSDGLVVNRSTGNASAIVATGNGTGHGIAATSGSGATGDGMRVTAASTNGHGLTLAKAGTGNDFNATSTPLTLAKTTNITGFNDIAATSIVSAGAITTSGGAVSTVTNVTNRVTANTDQLAGQTVTAGAGVTFPATVASPTNITGGTITTVTNLTNAPTSGDLTAAMKASVNTEVLDVLSVDTFAEPGQGAPAATATLAVKIAYLYKAFRNKVTQTSTTYSLFNDDAVTVDQKSTVSDDGTTFTRGEVASGP